MGAHPRLSGIVGAIKDGRTCPAIDSRYLTRPRGGKYPEKRSEICSYLDSLYESVAEDMPVDDSEGDAVPADTASLGTDPILPQDDYHNVNVVQDFSVEDGNKLEPGGERQRSLPPGTMYDYWRQFCETHPPGCGFKYFWEIWTQEYFFKLDFRGSFQHAVCGVCIKHKLLLRSLAHDTASRVKQRQLYDRHLSNQYLDRRVYWHHRALSRLGTNVITIIIDGMDQAKFMWPRSIFFRSHSFDKFSRPRLHITGCIVHGYFVLFVISHADLRKSGSTTVEILSMALQRLVDQGYKCFCKQPVNLNK